jgi:hypothetical protein
MRTTVSLPSEPEPEKNTCWNCGGEYGAVTYTEDNRVVIVQR